MFVPAFRPLFTLLLTGLILLGNAPAWWHHGTCNSEACRVVAKAVAAKADSSHCCCSHGHAASKSDATAACLLPQADDDNHQESHDSGDCLACQSAIAGLSASIQLPAEHSFSAIYSFAFVGCESAPATAVLDSVRPRGPPASFA